jgi:outer membrane protein assembly factor BamB
MGRGGPQTVYAIASDGVVHTLGVMEGKDVAKPVALLPANANVGDTIAIDQTLYVSTVNSCGNVPNGVWAIDQAAAEKKAISWKSGASPVGSLAFNSKGMLLVATGEPGSLVALDPKTLEVTDSYSLGGAAFATGPVIFTYNGREIAAAATKDGRIALVDATSPGGGDHKTPLFVSAPGNASRTLATWQDMAGTRYVLAPTAKGSIAAFKVIGPAEKPALEAAWTAGDLGSPSAPIVVNGVVFALKSGSAPTAAVLYAFDGVTGKELWNSGKTITSYVRSTGVWSSNGQVYVATHDGTVYAFGFAMDRHL